MNWLSESWSSLTIESETPQTLQFSVSNNNDHDLNLIHFIHILDTHLNYKGTLIKQHCYDNSNYKAATSNATKCKESYKSCIDHIK